MIDTHCHIDMYKNPHSIAEESERLGIVTIGMTLLPSHFELGFEHVKQYKKVRLALGMHPLKSELHKSEFNKFLFYLDKTSYIGEIGLDFSIEGINHKELQIESFKRILFSISGKPKIVSLHTRRAEKEVLQLLIENNISNAIFHWYSGSISLIDEIAKHGFYFSINPAMIKSKNGKKIIERIPKNLVLTETDGPYITIKGNIIRPKDVGLVEEFLTKKWGSTLRDVDEQIHNNFYSMVKNIS